MHSKPDGALINLYNDRKIAIAEDIDDIRNGLHLTINNTDGYEWWLHW